MMGKASKVAGAALTLALLSACGITAGPVRSQGRPIATDVGGTDTQRDLSPPAHIDSATELVAAFLQTPAVDDPAVRIETMKKFMVDPETWRPGTEIKVVRIIGAPRSLGTFDGTNTKVEVRVQHIGAFIDGAIVPPTTARGEETLTYTVVNVAGKGMSLKTPPSDLLLSDVAFSEFYQARALYFDTEGGGEVPDLRYVPIHFSEQRKAERLVLWLYSGPAYWLREAVRGFPADAPLEGKVSRDENGVLTVDLAKSVRPEEYARLYRLMSRTLVVDPVKGLRLTMQGAVGAMQALPSPRKEVTPSRFAVVGGSVVRLHDGTQTVDPAVRLNPEVNKNVVVAGFSRDTDGAVVAQQEGSHLKLMIGLRPALVKIDGIPAPTWVGQPVWINEGRRVMLLADGKIYQVGLNGDVTVVQGVPDGVTAMSVAPDGVRIAMVVNESLKISALKRAGTAVSLTSTADVPTGMLTRVHDVAFGRTGRQELVVAGVDQDRVKLVLMNLDGSQQALVNPRDNWHSSLRINRLSVDPQSGRALIEIKPLGSYEAQSSGSMSLQESLVTPSSAPPDQQPKVSAPSFEG